MHSSSNSIRVIKYPMDITCSMHERNKGCINDRWNSLTKRDAGLKWRSNDKCILERWRLLDCRLSAVTQNSISWGDEISSFKEIGNLLTTK